MGCGMSAEDKEGKVRNEEIENQLKRDKLSQRNEIKMLLLGMHIVILRMSLAFRLIYFRCWRVGQVHDLETDEAHPRRWILKG